MRFFVTSVPAAGVNDDGDGILVRLSDDTNKETIELVAHYTVFEELMNAFNEASAKAHAKRRELWKIDEPVKRGDIGAEKLLGYRYMVASDKSHMILQVQLPTRRIDINIPRENARDFFEATQRNVASLGAPVRDKGH